MLPQLETILHQMRADRLSGATALATGVCSSLGHLCVQSQVRPSKNDIEEFALAVADAQPNMGSMWNIANGILHRSSDVPSVGDFCAKTATHLSSAPARLAEQASAAVSGKRIITTSSSSAVFHTVLRAARDPGTSVIACESRPMREGVLMARELGRLGVSVTVIADAALSLFSSEASVGIVGVDAVNKDGIIGKIGLSHMSFACRSRNIPMLVLADSLKFAPIALRRDRRDPCELLEPGISEVRVDNQYFEHVPFDQVAAVFTEKGRLTSDDAKRSVWGAKVHPRLAKRTQ